MGRQDIKGICPGGNRNVDASLCQAPGVIVVALSALQN